MQLDLGYWNENDTMCGMLLRIGFVITGITAAAVVFIVVTTVTGVGDEYESFVAVAVFVVAVRYFDLAATGPIIIVVVVVTGSLLNVEAFEASSSIRFESVTSPTEAFHLSSFILLAFLFAEAIRTISDEELAF